MSSWSCSEQDHDFPRTNSPQSSLTLLPTPNLLAHFSLCPIRSFRSRNSWHLGGVRHTLTLPHCTHKSCGTHPGVCQTLGLASPTEHRRFTTTPHVFAPRRCSTPTRVPKPRAATRATAPRRHTTPPRFHHLFTIKQQYCIELLPFPYRTNVCWTTSKPR